MSVAGAQARRGGGPGAAPPPPPPRDRGQAQSPGDAGETMLLC